MEWIGYVMGWCVVTGDFVGDVLEEGRFIYWSDDI